MYDLHETQPQLREETLDPSDWNDYRELGHKILDEAIDYLANVRSRPIWQTMPDSVRGFYRSPLPISGSGLDEVYKELGENLMPYPLGNIHPRYWMWYMGSSNFSGAVGDFLAAILGSNLGGGNHAAAEMDRQVVDWCKQMVGFPEEASGTLVSGGSMANLIGLNIARNVHAGEDIRGKGLQGIRRPLVFYASDQVHGCHQKSLECLGLGASALRKLPSDDQFKLDLDALRTTISQDRKAGLEPACVIATAGTVNTGAIDDLGAIADLCEEEDLWFHVDGCIGALMAIAPKNRWKVAAIDRADSIALDPHKWLHAPFELGCALVKDKHHHRNTFALNSPYLEKTERGIAAAEWLHDYGLQTSRGFRALKLWISLKEHGVEKFGRLIDQNIAQAAYLKSIVEAESRLELMAPVEASIVCFRYCLGGADEELSRRINREIMYQLQETGMAAMSDTTIKGRYSLRVAINNHRTRIDDIDQTVTALLHIGDTLSSDAPI